MDVRGPSSSTSAPDIHHPPSPHPQAHHPVGAAGAPIPHRTVSVAASLNPPPNGSLQPSTVPIPHRGASVPSRQPFPSGPPGTSGQSAPNLAPYPPRTVASTAPYPPGVYPPGVSAQQHQRGQGPVVPPYGPRQSSVANRQPSFDNGGGGPSFPRPDLQAYGGGVATGANLGRQPSINPSQPNAQSNPSNPGANLGRQPSITPSSNPSNTGGFVPPPRVQTAVAQRLATAPIPKRAASVFSNFTTDELLEEGCKFLSPAQLNAQDALLRFRTATDRAKQDNDLFREAKAAANQAVARRTTHDGRADKAAREECVQLLRDAWSLARAMLQRAKVKGGANQRSSWVDLSTEFVEEVERRINVAHGGAAERPGAQGAGTAAPGATSATPAASAGADVLQPREARARRVGNWGFKMVEGRGGLKALDPVSGPPMVAFLMDLTNNLGNACFALGRLWEAVAWWEASVELTDRILRQFPAPVLPKEQGGAQSGGSAGSTSASSTPGTPPPVGAAASAPGQPSPDKPFKLLFLHRVTLNARARAWTHIGYALSTAGFHEEAIHCHQRAIDTLDTWEPLAEAHQDSLAAQAKDEGKDVTGGGKTTAGATEANKGLPRRVASVGKGVVAAAGVTRQATAVVRPLTAAQQANAHTDATLATIARLRGICHSHLATAYEGMGRLRLVIKNRREAIELFKACGDRLSETREKGNLGGALVQWGKTAGELVLGPERLWSRCVPEDVAAGDDVSGVASQGPRAPVYPIEDGVVPGFPPLREEELAGSDEEEVLSNGASAAASYEVQRRPRPLPAARLAVKVAMSGVSYLMDQWYVASRIGDWLGVAASAANLGNSFIALSNPLGSMFFYIRLYVPSRQGVNRNPSAPTVPGGREVHNAADLRGSSTTREPNKAFGAGSGGGAESGEDFHFLWKDAAKINISVAACDILLSAFVAEATLLDPRARALRFGGADIDPYGRASMDAPYPKRGSSQPYSASQLLPTEQLAIFRKIGIQPDPILRSLDSATSPPSSSRSRLQMQSQDVDRVDRGQITALEEVVGSMKGALLGDGVSLTPKETDEIVERVRYRLMEGHKEASSLGMSTGAPGNTITEIQKKDRRLDDTKIMRLLTIARSYIAGAMAIDQLFRSASPGQVSPLLVQERDRWLAAGLDWLRKLLDELLDNIEPHLKLEDVGSSRSSSRWPLVLQRLTRVCRIWVETIGNNVIAVETPDSPSASRPPAPIGGPNGALPATASPGLIASVLVTSATALSMSPRMGSSSPPNLGEGGSELLASMPVPENVRVLFLRAARLLALKFSLGMCRRCIESLARNRNLVVSVGPMGQGDVGRTSSGKSGNGVPVNARGVPVARTGTGSASSGRTPPEKPKSRTSFMPGYWKSVENPMVSCSHVESAGGVMSTQPLLSRGAPSITRR
ncbi:hypothetical protein HDU93_001033 [Gonapodya sp. JEL0774]|nr:hypothetical protein HDU93_001033 [Gonapodya sp. JEL0774]